MIKERDYCLFIDCRKYNRNIGCRKHDNAYGINGGGGESERKAADLAFYRHMQSEGDPLAGITYAACRVFGWLYFNYFGRPWHGQLIKKIFSSYNRQ